MTTCPATARLRRAIEAAIPLSAGNYNTTLTATASTRVETLTKLTEKAGFDPAAYGGNWPLQLGSLGSGNHFIEVTVDESGSVWLFLHSGSRGVGNRMATHHIRIAQEAMKRWWIDLPDADLAYLVEGTDEFWTYIRQLRWAQEFALANRDEMMDRMIACFGDWYEPVVELERVQCHHNYTERERHFGREVWLSRKGAIHAAEGVLGLIPGSMGAASYVVVGKGNRRDAADLVEIRHTLRQIVNVKGD